MGPGEVCESTGPLQPHSAARFPIKGFAFDKPSDSWQANVRIASSQDAITVCKGSSKAVAYELFGADAARVAGLGLEVTWGLVDAAQDCVDVVQQDDGIAQLVWKKPGKARVFVNVDGIGTAFATVAATDAEHAWGEPTYTWSDDLATCTATRACAACGEVETETVKTTSKVTKQLTENAEGVRTYTAAFNNPAFATQTKDAAIAKTQKDEAQKTPQASTASGGTTSKAPQGTSKATRLAATDDPVPVAPTAVLFLLSVAVLAVATRASVSKAA